MFDPLHAQVHQVTMSDVGALACFGFSKRTDYKQHIDQMKTELGKYNSLVALIKPESERLVKVRGTDKLEDSWDMQSWWRLNKVEIPAFFKVLQAVLTHSPNSCVPEAIFSVLANSFDSNQKNAYADYMEYSLQRQYNNRNADWSKC